MEKWKVALVGTGVWGKQHARALKSREDVDFCAIVGRKPEKTRLRAAEYGTRWYTDIPEMIRKEKPDFVSLCLPAQETFEPVMQVIRAGIPLLSEKPIGYDLEEARTMVREARKRGVFFGVDFNHSMSIPVQMAKEYMEGGKIGEPVFASWKFAQNRMDIPHPYLAAIESQCHGFDTLEYLLGPVESISADMNNKAGKNSFSTFSASLRFVDGTVASFLGSFDGSANYEYSHMLEVDGTLGRVLAEDNVKRFVFQRRDDPHSEIWRPSLFDLEGGSFFHNLDRHYDKIFEALRTGSDAPIPGERGIRALKVSLACVEAFETGRRVLVEPGL